MKKLLAAMLVALLMVGCGGGDSGSDSPESNQSSAETPPAKTSQVEQIDLDDLGTRKKITEEAILYFQVRPRKKEGQELAYAPNQQTPYSGWAKMYHGRKKEQVRMLRQYREGKLDGPYVSWWKNGQKMLNATFKNGKTMTMVMWKPNGEKCPITNVMNGNGVQVWYHEDGTEERRVTFKDGYRSYPSEVSSANLSVPAPTNPQEELLADILASIAIPQDGFEVAKIDLNHSGTPDALRPIDEVLKEVDELIRFYDLEDLLRHKEDGAEKRRDTYKDGEKVRASSRTKGELPLDIEPSGDEKFYELNDLITNIGGGPIKGRYIDVQLKLEGLAEDFEKILEQNEHQMRDKALIILGNYTYEEAQLDGFQERVRVDLKKGFSSILRKHRDGESDLIRQISFTQFVIK
jgi:flagellar basal body-associated protein FliL